MDHIFKKIKNCFIFFFLVFLFFIPIKVHAQEGSFYLSPASGNYGSGSTFNVNVLVKVQGIAINAAEAVISFPPDKLEVVQISKNGSIFSMWAEEPAFSNTKGKISFVGGVPSPGFQGNSGKVFTILFKTKNQGIAKVNFSDEKILANDPHGTDIFNSSSEGNYNIIASDEFTAALENQEPTKIQGVKDNDPPEEFEIIVNNEGDPTNPRPLLYFETKDKISGMQNYEMKIGDQDPFAIPVGQTVPFRLPAQAPGTYQIAVKAIDKSGNIREEKTELTITSIASPVITFCPEVYRAGEETLYIKGTASPETNVALFLTKDNKAVKDWDIFSDGEGDWSFGKEDLFRSGIYKIYAQAKDQRGAISNPSNSCDIKVVLGGVAIGSFAITYKTINLIAVIIFILLAILIFYLFRRYRKTTQLMFYLSRKHRNTMQSIETETEDLKKKFYKEYNELKEAIERKLFDIRTAKNTRQITDEEKREEEKLLKELADVEAVLMTELKDIEKYSK